MGIKYKEILKIAINVLSKMNIDCENPSMIRIISKSNPTESLNYHIKKYIRNKETYRIETSIKSLDFLTSEVYGIYRKYSVSLNTYKVSILINNNNGNTCWQRLVTAKELSHMLLGEEEKTWTKDIQILISELLENSSIFNSSIQDVLETEYLSLFLAMELMVPYCYNHLLIDDTYTAEDIANIFKIPEKIIDIMKKETYQKLRTKVFAEIEAEKSSN